MRRGSAESVGGEITWIHGAKKGEKMWRVEGTVGRELILRSSPLGWKLDVMLYILQK